MRQIKIINDNWAFINEDIDICNITDITGSIVNLPHTWNASDGQDGGNDYCRGRKWYVKKLIRPESDGNCEVWLEFSAAAMVSDVYINGHHLGHHEGGYSTFRINMTDVLLEENVIAVAVDILWWNLQRCIFNSGTKRTFLFGVLWQQWSENHAGNKGRFCRSQNRGMDRKYTGWDFGGSSDR